MPDLLCSLCTLTFSEYAQQQLGLRLGQPCPDRETCLEDGPCSHAVLLGSIEDCDAWDGTPIEGPRNNPHNVNGRCGYTDA